MKSRLATLAPAAVLIACGPSAASLNSAGQSGGMETSSSTASSEEASEGSVGGSTGEVAVPVVCDPSFDSGLARGEVIWTQTFPIPEISRLLGITMSSSGEAYVVGSRDESHQALDGWFLHLAADGTLQHGIERDLDQDVEFEDVALAPDGQAIVVGYENLSGTQTLVVYAFAPDGTLVWREPVELGVEAEVAGWSPRIAVSSQGRTVVGANWWREGGGGFSLVELGPTGERIRSFPLPAEAPADLEMRDLGIDPAGALYVGGGAGEGVGDLEWVGRWDADGMFLGSWEHAERGARVVELSPREDGVLVLGVDFTREGFPAYVRPRLRRYDGAGTELWARVIDVEEVGEDPLSPYELAVDCLGRGVVHAQHSGGSGINHWLFTIDDNGDEVDRRKLELDINLGEYQPGIYDITTDPFGNVVLGLSAPVSPDGIGVQILAR